MNDIFNDDRTNWLSNNDVQGSVDIEDHETPKRSSGLPGNDKELQCQWQSIRESTIRRLYKNDPLIRAGLDLQIRMEAARRKEVPSSTVAYDDDGKLLPPKKSLLQGASSKEQMEYMQAIRKLYE